MSRHSERVSTGRIALWIAAIAGGIIVALVAGGFAVGAFLKTPAVPTAPQQPTASVPATTAPSTDATTVAKAPKPAAKPKPKPQPKKPPAPKPAAPAPVKPAASKGVIVIDPGHQHTGDNSTEPIGPGSSQRKPKVTYGASGVVTHKDESLVNLEVSLKLRDQLQKRGFKVIMVRTSQNVNIANSARAAIANRAHADLFIRIHCDSIGTSSRQGLSTLVPARNQWTGPIVSKSAAAGRAVQKATLAATGAQDRGIVPRSDMSGFNWSKVPSIIVEMGFLSNPAEDRRLNTPSYQDKLAVGLANGVANFVSR